MALPLWNSKTTQTTLSCLHPNVGRLWGFVGVDNLKPSTVFAHFLLAEGSICFMKGSEILTFSEKKRDKIGKFRTGRFGTFKTFKAQFFQILYFLKRVWGGVRIFKIFNFFILKF